MAPRKQAAMTLFRDPLALMREMTADLDRMFETPGWRLPAFFRSRVEPAVSTWFPNIDVFEKDSRLVTKIDLPGMKKDDVKVEVTDGHLTISGERKTESEEKKEHYYRSEREYGSFSRTVPLPEGVTLEDVKATFADGVLEVSVPLPAKPEARVRTVEIQDASQAKPAA